MIKLSAVIITLNEERCIERCIDSLIDVADEIIVIDSYSTDSTVSICETKGARVIMHEFEGYVEQKNFAISQASFDYILSIDGDEELSPELKNSILKTKNFWKYEGYRMNCYSNYCGKWINHSGWYPDKKLRLFKKGSGRWEGRSLHERYELFESKSLGFLKGDILHYSYYSIEQHMDKIDKYSDISSRAMFDEGKRFSVLNLLINPIVKFLINYIFRLGFLDGYYGLLICYSSARATFLKYYKLRFYE